jgi:hypothetical protein
MSKAPEDRTARLRWGVYAVLIAIAVGNMTGRLIAVNSVDRMQLEVHRIQERLGRERQKLVEEGLSDERINDQMAAAEARLRNELRLQRPFLSANDRSRWMTIRSLVEHGTYEIDKILKEPTWDTIDMVQHRGWDGELHLYSSKPPLLATLIAGEYWLINRLTGATLRDHPYEIGRAILVTVNILPLVLMFVLVAKLAERFGNSDWGRVFVVAAATMGTMLSAFAVVLNNHIVGAVSAAITLYMLVRISADGERRWRYFFVAGLVAAFTVTNELPALVFFALVSLLLLWHAPGRTLLGFAPGAAIVAAAFFATNWIAHQSLRPPYAHRSASDPSDNWYHYTYTVNGKERQSYWMDPKGIDRGEPSTATYALHSLIGHHGVFSLTPIWLLSIAGIGMWLRWPDWTRRELAALTAAVSLACLVFFIGFREQHDRNYGGMTSGFRWMFWCAPMWLVVMIPAADRLANSRIGKAFAIVLLTFSVLSASYPTWNPWTHPWIYNWLVWSGWQGF